MSERMTDEAYEAAEESAVELAFQECPPCTCDGESGEDTIHRPGCPRYAMIAALDEVLDESTRARSEEARLLEENRKQAEQIKALADAMEAAREYGMSSQKAWDATTMALRLVGRL